MGTGKPLLQVWEKRDITHCQAPRGDGNMQRQTGSLSPNALVPSPPGPFPPPRRTVGKNQCGCPAVPGSRGGSCGSFFHAGHSFSLERGCKQQFPPGLKEVLSTHIGSPGGRCIFLGFNVLPRQRSNRDAARVTMMTRGDQRGRRGADPARKIPPASGAAPGLPPAPLHDAQLPLVSILCLTL